MYINCGINGKIQVNYYSFIHQLTSSNLLGRVWWSTENDEISTIFIYNAYFDQRTQNTNYLRILTFQKCHQNAFFDKLET